ncbi:MAG: tetratricopeptide repeat protein [Calditrichaeota bacterium]|nr:tetratricopeptide repeat protein [Calditrichota bacterium]
MRRLTVLIFVMLILPTMLPAQPGRKQVLEGNKLYAEKKFDKANNKYRDAQIEDPNNPVIHFNIGNALYQKKKYEDAQKDFEKSLSVDDVMTQAKVYYNMGNVFYRLGKLPESILAYTQALKLNPEDEDAKYNLEFVRKKLKEQAKKQPQNQQQQQKQQQKQKQDQQQQKKQQQQKQKQEQQKQEQQQQKQQQQQQNQQKQKMSKEEAERILNALNKEDKDLQKKRKAKSAGKIRVVKDW